MRQDKLNHVVGMLGWPAPSSDTTCYLLAIIKIVSGADG